MSIRPVGGAGDKRTVLVVDDDPAILRLHQRMAQLGALNPLLASDMREARQLLRDHSVDLLVTDMTMPGGTGLELLDTIRDAHPELKTMMVSGGATLADVQAARRLGIRAYVPKPYSATELLAEIKRILADD